MSDDYIDLNERLYRLTKIISDAEKHLVESGYAELDDHGYLRYSRKYRHRRRQPMPIYVPPEYLSLTIRRRYPGVRVVVTLLYVFSMLTTFAYMLVF